MVGVKPSPRGLPGCSGAPRTALRTALMAVLADLAPLGFAGAAVIVHYEHLLTRGLLIAVLDFGTATLSGCRDRVLPNAQTVFDVGLSVLHSFCIYSFIEATM